MGEMGESFDRTPELNVLAHFRGKQFAAFVKNNALIPIQPWAANLGDTFSLTPDVNQPCITAITVPTGKAIGRKSHRELNVLLPCLNHLLLVKVDQETLLLIGRNRRMQQDVITVL